MRASFGAPDTPVSNTLLYKLLECGNGYKDATPSPNGVNQPSLDVCANCVLAQANQAAGFLNMMGGGLPMGDMPESMNMELSKSNGQILIKMDLK